MHKNSVTVALSFLAILACPKALADGLIHNGHANGPHTLLTLTKGQILELAHKKTIITLTDSQRKALAHLPNAASVKEIEVLPKTYEGCTCELINVAVRIDNRSIEVANTLFGRDREKEYSRYLEGKAEREKAQSSYSPNNVTDRFQRLIARLARQLKLNDFMSNTSVSGK